MESKKKSTKGILLSVGVWMMISYGTFGSEIPENHEKIENIEEKEHKKIEYTESKNPEIIEKESEEPKNEKENHEKLIDEKEEITEIKIKETASPSEIIDKVISKSSKIKALKDCIEAIEKSKSKEFTVDHARCCCWSGNILDAKITEIKANTTKTVREIIKEVLIYDDDNKSIKLKNDNDTMARKTDIYDVFKKAINYANKKKKETKEELEEKHDEGGEQGNNEEKKNEEEEKLEESNQEPKEDNKEENKEEEKKEEENLK